MRYDTILLFLLLLRLLQLWPLEILQVRPLFLRRTLSFREHVLTFWHCTVLQDHLVFSLPPPALEPVTYARREGLFFKLILRN